jgi:hypothetical protein
MAALNVFGVEMKIGISIAVLVISLITAHILFSTQHYAKSQLSSVCDFLNNRTGLIPRVGPQAKIHLRMAKSKYSQFRCQISNESIPYGLPFTIAIDIRSDSDEIMVLFYGFNFGGIRHFMQPVYYHQESHFEHDHI